MSDDPIDLGDNPARILRQLAEASGRRLTPEAYVSLEEAERWLDEPATTEPQPVAPEWMKNAGTRIRRLASRRMPKA